MKAFYVKFIIIILCSATTSCVFFHGYAPNSLVRKWNDAINYRNTWDKINLTEEYKVVAERERLFSGISPLVSLDGKTLYYSEKIYLSSYDDVNVMKYSIEGGSNQDKGEHFEVKKKGENLKIDYISMNNDTVIYSYYVRDPIEKTGDHFYYFFRTIKSFNVWSKPDCIYDIDLMDDYGNFYFLYSSLSNCQNYFMYSASSYKGYGGSDIFVKIRKENGRYGKPINIGSIVNTQGMEYGVFLASDNKTLFFSSMGHPGYGNADIFVTKRLDDSWTRWTKPVNLGPEINTQEYESDFVITQDKKLGFVVGCKEVGDDSNIYLVKFELNR